MKIAINEAKGKLSGLIKKANSGEQIFLTSHGKPVAEIRPIIPKLTPNVKMEIIHEIQASCVDNKDFTAENVSDFLYNDEGLPK